MIRKFFLYFRQAFALMKEDKQYSAIYIAGTAVAIASAMLVAIILNIQLANIYPETNRDRTLYVGGFFHYSGAAFALHFGFSPEGVDELFRKLECVETVSVSASDNDIYDFKACIELGKQELPVCVNFTDDAFFRLYSFRFVAGKPFTEENVKHGDKCIVITDVLAKKMWGNESEAVGKSLLLNYLPYRVVGVVKEVSPLLRKSSADVYSPYSVKDSNMHYIDSKNRYNGDLVVSVLLKKGFTRQMMLDELEPHKARILSELKSTTGIDYQWEIIARPHWAESMIMFFGSASDYSTSKLLLNLLLPVLLMLLFLLLPAINLSGMVSNRMESRVAEMGIRKAFGAKKRVLLGQVMQENLVLTFFGGIVGYALSCGVVAAISSNPMFLTFFQRENDLLDSVSVQFGMFFTPIMFLIVFVCCVVLNLMAALIPSWTSLKRPIVESLNQKK